MSEQDYYYLTTYNQTYSERLMKLKSLNAKVKYKNDG